MMTRRSFFRSAVAGVAALAGLGTLAKPKFASATDWGTFSFPWSYLVRMAGNTPYTQDDVLPSRLTDWPNPSSVQGCDCVLSSDFLPGQVAVQYKNFPPYTSFRDSAGNGGDLLAVTADGWVLAIGTADGGHLGRDGQPALYYFTGPGLSGIPGNGRIGGWTICTPDINPGGWVGVENWIVQASPGPEDIEGQPSPAYTQFILATIDVPFLSAAGAPEAQPLNCIVSEHYGAAQAWNAPEMERFIYAEGYGLVRWEAWATSGTRVPGALQRAIPFPSYGYPQKTNNAAHTLTDCRTFTYFNPAVPAIAQSSAGWPNSTITLPSTVA